MIVGRFGPERTAEALTQDRSTAGTENEEGDDLLLASVREPGGESAVQEHTEAPQELDAQRDPSSHRLRLHATPDVLPTRTEPGTGVAARKLQAAVLIMRDGEKLVWNNYRQEKCGLDK